MLATPHLKTNICLCITGWVGWVGVWHWSY